MSILYFGDCLTEMNEIADNSVDLIYTDLPYATKSFGGCTDCDWDKPVDLEKMWEHFMRIKKINTPIFFSCNTKLGYDLIKYAPKKCPFRYDLIWVKSNKSGFLSSKRQPLRSHELVYVFYEKLPFYDLSSHKHKFVKTNTYTNKDNIYGSDIHPDGKKKLYKPPLPDSVLNKEDKLYEKTTYGDIKIPPHPDSKGGARWNPPLPSSVLNKKPEMRPEYETDSKVYGEIKRSDFKRKGGESMYKPPLPESVLNKEPAPEPEICPPDESIKSCYNYTERVKSGKLKSIRNSGYEPPLPSSIIKEEKHNIYGFPPEKMIDERPSNNRESAYEPPLPDSVLNKDCKFIKRTDKGCESLYGKEDKKVFIYDKDGKLRNSEPRYEPPLPSSVLGKEDKHTLYGEIKDEGLPHTTTYDPPLPSSLLEVRSTRGKHSTEKPVALMSWILKYFSKEDDIIFDCCMGSGSMGVACKEMNRNFIGIEMNPEIFEVACERIYED
tara:strand:- start:2282 stop:3760 length:1479 start_codon:yes stop_codon:yes gene_type:complete